MANRVERCGIISGHADGGWSRAGLWSLHDSLAFVELEMKAAGIVDSWMKGFSLFAQRAVLSRHGDEIIDLAEFVLFR